MVLKGETMTKTKVGGYTWVLFMVEKHEMVVGDVRIGGG